MVPAARLVWSVEKTRWPVSDAWMAIWAVSVSRISPTRMTSGSWRRIARRQAANVKPTLSLIMIWMTPSSWSLGWEIFWKGLLVIAVTRAVVGCSQLLLNSAEGGPKPLGVFALITSLFATLTGILFTAPVAIEVFRLNVPELYWKFAVAALLLTALGLSITLLLRWSYGSGSAAPRARRAPAVAAPLPGQVVQQPAASGEQQLLPWPTFADGRPLPMGPDGQPDFSVLQQ